MSREIVSSGPFSGSWRVNWGRLQAGKPLNQGLLAGRKFLGNDAAPGAAIPGIHLWQEKQPVAQGLLPAG